MATPRPRLLAVRTGPDGCAQFGWISPGSSGVNGALEDWPEREARSKMDFHHPKTGVGVLLTVRKGLLEIILGSPGAPARMLHPGDQILFCDWQPATAPVVGRAGHSSVAGDQGASLYRVQYSTPPDLDALGWEPVEIVEGEA